MCCKICGKELNEETGYMVIEGENFCLKCLKNYRYCITVGQTIYKGEVVFYRVMELDVYNNVVSVQDFFEGSVEERIENGKLYWFQKRQENLKKLAKWLPDSVEERTVYIYIKSIEKGTKAYWIILDTFSDEGSVSEEKGVEVGDNAKEKVNLIVLNKVIDRCKDQKVKVKLSMKTMYSAIQGTRPVKAYWRKTLGKVRELIKEGRLEVELVKKEDNIARIRLRQVISQ